MSWNGQMLASVAALTNIRRASPQALLPGAHAFRKKDVGFAGTVGIRHDAGDPKTKTEIELVRMLASEFLEVANQARDVRIEVNSADTRFIVLVITAQPQSQRASGPGQTLEVMDQRPPNALPSI